MFTGIVIGFVSAVALHIYNPVIFEFARVKVLKGINAVRKAFSSAPPAQ